MIVVEVETKTPLEILECALNRDQQDTEQCHADIENLKKRIRDYEVLIGKLEQHAHTVKTAMGRLGDG